MTVYSTWGGVIQSPVEWNNEHVGLNPEVIVGLFHLIIKTSHETDSRGNEFEKVVHEDIEVGTKAVVAERQ